MTPDEARWRPSDAAQHRCLECGALLHRGRLFPLCRLCQDAHCVVCNTEIVPVDGHLCTKCRITRATVFTAREWTLLRIHYRLGVYQS